MNVPAKVNLFSAFCKNPQKKMFASALCYHENSPIPWAEKLFIIKDKKNRLWFCHNIALPANSESLRQLATYIERDNSLVCKEGVIEKVRKPVEVNAVVVWYPDFESLQDILTEVKI